MNKGYYCRALFFSGILALSSGLLGCSEDKLEEGDASESVIIETDPNIKVQTTSASFTMNLSGVESYAYQIVEGEVTKAPSGALIYSNAMQDGGSGVKTATVGENVVTVYGLEGKKTYTIFFAFKTGKEYVVKGHTVTTPEYTQLVTLVNTDKFAATFHIAAGTDSFRYALIPSDKYFSLREQFSYSDLDFLKNNSGLIATKDTTITVENGQSIVPTDPEISGQYVINPAFPYILLVGKCDGQGEIKYELDPNYEWDEDIDDGFGQDVLSRSSSKAPELAGYVEEETGYKDVNIIFKEKIAKLNFYTELLDTQENEVTINELICNERTAKFSFTPSKNVVKYGVAVLTANDYNKMLAWAGEKGEVGMLLGGDILQSVSTQAEEMTISPMEKDTTYLLVVLGSYNEDFTKVSLHKQEFSAKESSLPAPELVIEPVSMDDPYKVAFRVKSKNEYCSSFRYSVNYSRDWAIVGQEDIAVINKFGVLVDDPKEIQKLNNPEGLVMEFDSRESTENRLVIVGYNADEKASELVSDVSTSATETKARVESTLFNELVGDWTLTYNYGYYNDESMKRDSTVVFKVTIADAPNQSPYASYNEFYESDGWRDQFMFKAQTAGYENVMEIPVEEMERIEKEIESDFNKYAETVKTYKERYRNMNRLVIQGFDPLHEYASPWDLFCSTSYSAYSIDDMFYDYGPKIFLEVLPDGKLIIPSDPHIYTGVQPVSNWKPVNYQIFAGGIDLPRYLLTQQFPVGIDDSRQNLEIPALAKNDTVYAFSLGNMDLSTMAVTFETYGKGSVTLKKGAPGPVPSRYYSAFDGSSMAPIKPNRKDGRYMRTRLSKFVPTKQVEATPFVWKQWMDNRMRGWKNK